MTHIPSSASIPADDPDFDAAARAEQPAFPKLYGDDLIDEDAAIEREQFGE